MKNVYTHDLAAVCIEEFENLLESQNITLSSPEDTEKDPENKASIYGSTYSTLLENIENILITTCEKHNIPFTPNKFSKKTFKEVISHEHANKHQLRIRN